MVELQRCTDKEQWDDYVLDNGGHPLQLWSWGQVKAGHGWRAERLFAYDNDVIVAAAQVLIRTLPLPLRAFAYVPRGPIVPTVRDLRRNNLDPECDDASVAAVDGLRNEFLAELARFVKREYHAVALSIEPDEFAFEKPDGWVRSLNKVLPAETILLDLHRSESELLADMAKKTRQYIRKSASEVQIKPVKSQQAIEECLKIYAQTAQRAGFNLHDAQYYRDVYMQLKDYSPIFGAYVDDELVAFLWLAISGETAYELYGGVTETGQNLRANYALKWHAIRKIKEWGLGRYDFGGMVAGGVSTFKQGWSRDVTLFAGTFDKSLSPFYPFWSRGLPLAKRTLQTVKRKK